jgi:hypothetical protein
MVLRACATGRIESDPDPEDSSEPAHPLRPPIADGAAVRRLVRRLNEAGVFPADGLDYEICFGSEGNLKVSQVWDSQGRWRLSVSASCRSWRRWASIQGSRKSSKCTTSSGARQTACHGVTTLPCLVFACAWVGVSQFGIVGCLARSADAVVQVARSFADGVQAGERDARAL